MSANTTSVFSLALDKLHAVCGGGSRNGYNLHRWVLLKNFAHSHLTLATEEAERETDADSYRREELSVSENEDGFILPDPYFIGPQGGVTYDNESEWLDALLEDLTAEEQRNSVQSPEASTSVISTPEDFDEPLSPLYTPMSSTDDFGENLLSPDRDDAPLEPAWYELEDSPDSTRSSPLTIYDHPLPYYNVDSVQDLSVPGAIDDLSDEEEDSPATPSVTSASSSLDDSDALHTPLEQPRGLPHPRVFVDMDNSYFRSYEIDPLPFADSAADPTPAFVPSYQEC